MASFNHTLAAMRRISYVVSHIQYDPLRWHKVNWIIIGASHDMYWRRGRYGHNVRQKIRHRLWAIAQRKYPVLKRYRIPKEINGDSQCKVKWYYLLWDFCLRNGTIIKYLALIYGELRLFK